MRSIPGRSVSWFIRAEYSSEWHLILAFITLTILPTIILFLLAQKHIVAGLTAGAVKG